jgi:hypothetical protein
MRKSAKLLVALALSWAGTAHAQAPPRPVQLVGATQPATRPMLTVPMDAIPADFRTRVNSVVKQPTVTARAAPEEFEQGIYNWLLEHPDRASLAWKRLGIPCAEITDRGNGLFGWSDNDGTEVRWRTVATSDVMRVWYAEGHTKLGPMMPTIPVRAVVVLHNPRTKTRDGRVIVAHATDVYLQTDSKATAMVMKVLGSASPQLADQGAGQLLLFFSGLTRYFNKHPEDVESLLAAKP